MVDFLFDGVPIKVIIEWEFVYLFDGIPIENVVVGEPLSVEEVPYELPQVRIVGFLLEAKWATVIQVGRKLGWK